MSDRVVVRNTQTADIPGIIEMTRAVYPGSIPWNEKQLASHLTVFPEGQFVAVESDNQRIVGMAASLIVFWDDYDVAGSWRDFTDYGMFTNHDPEKGRTLYGAEVMVHPEVQGRGIGTMLYSARENLVKKLGLRRIRAGARLRGYHKYASTMTPDEYVRQIEAGEIWDATLSFQLRRNFRVIAVVANYLRHDPESLGYAAIIEWLNPLVTPPFQNPPPQLLN